MENERLWILEMAFFCAHACASMQHAQFYAGIRDVSACLLLSRLQPKSLPCFGPILFRVRVLILN